jgi:hypothetical protein
MVTALRVHAGIEGSFEWCWDESGNPSYHRRETSIVLDHGSGYLLSFVPMTSGVPWGEGLGKDDLGRLGAHTLLLQVEDEALLEEVEQCIAERVPNLNEVISVAYVKTFQMTLGALMGIVLLALLVASFIPNARAPSEAGGGSTSASEGNPHGRNHSSRVHASHVTDAYRLRARGVRSRRGGLQRARALL